jgi:photoactive yellow protein
MVAERSDSPVICAWCSAELKRGGLMTPMSHGICLPCMAATSGDPIVDLSHVPPEVLDALPYGAIQLTGDGVITAYSRAESQLSGLSPERVIGKNFFRQVAPCTAVQDFQGVLEELRSKGENGRAKLRFVFTFARGAKLVEVAMVYHAATDSATLLVRVVLSEPKL